MSRNLAGIIAGIIAFLLAFLGEIPIYPPENLIFSFRILSSNNIDLYFWGYIFNGNVSYSFINTHFPENLIALVIWAIIFLIGVNSIIASIRKSNISSSVLLFKINIVFIVVLLLIFGFNILFLSLTDLIKIFYIIGPGYYFILIILILHLKALDKRKKELK